jgi:hypothetical protein
MKLRAAKRSPSVKTAYTGALLGLAIATTALGLAACGGDSAPATRAEGVYSGTQSGSASNAFLLLALENDEYWALYGTSTASSFFVAGFLQGQGVSDNGSFTSSNLKDFGTVPPTSGSVSASYVVNTRVSGAITEPGGSVSFSGTPIPGPSYDYNVPAKLSDLAGAWSLTVLDGSAATMTIAASGAFTGSMGGCTFTGTLAPRPSGKNVFNLSLTFGAAPCPLPNETGTGVALSYLLNGGVNGIATRQLMLVGVNAARTSGTAAFGSR